MIRQILLFVCSLWFGWSGMGQAAPNAPDPVQKNLSIINDNLDRLKQNSDAADQNVATLESELTDLDTLEAKHLSLRKKYADLLTQARSHDKTAEASAKDSDADKKAAIAFETEKEARLQRFLDLLDKNLQDVQSRRDPIRSELAALKARRAQYATEISRLTEKKATLLRVNPRPSPSIGP